MSDNVNINTGAGATVRTDDVSGVQYQFIKMDVGGDGVSIPVVSAMSVGFVSNPTVLLTGTPTIYSIGSGVRTVLAIQSGNWSVDVTNTAGLLVAAAQSGTWLFNQVNTANIPVIASQSGIYAVTATATIIGLSSTSLLAVGNINLGVTAFFIAALSDNKVQVKGANALLKGYDIYNPNGATQYVQIFNANSNNVTVGSTTAQNVIAVPGVSNSELSFGEPGIVFGTAITLASTTTPTGGTASGTGLLVNMFFK